MQIPMQTVPRFSGMTTFPKTPLQFGSYGSFDNKISVETTEDRELAFLQTLRLLGYGAIAGGVLAAILSGGMHKAAEQDRAHLIHDFIANCQPNPVKQPECTDATIAVTKKLTPSPSLVSKDDQKVAVKDPRSLNGDTDPVLFEALNPFLKQLPENVVNDVKKLQIDAQKWKSIGHWELVDKKP